MSTFMETAACRGVRPSGIVSSVQRPRSELIARLLKERRVARFIVAPDGYGKSSLVYAYADVVFSFRHTFWINGRSPCFLRDLDASTMALAMRRIDDAPCLVIFEDVPRLDADRTMLFAQLVDTLLDWGNEVIVTCAPSGDAYGGHHQDRLLITARDMLLNDDEMHIALRGEQISEEAIAAEPAAERVACLKWKRGGERDLLLGIRREELPSDVMLAAVTLLVLQRGEVDDLRAFVSFGARRLAEVILLLEEGYPFLGIAASEGTFETVHVDAAVLGETLGHPSEALVRASAFKDRDTLIARFSDALVSRGEHERAMGVVMAFATKGGCGAWLVQRGWRFIADGAALPVRNVHAVVARSSFRNRSACNAIVAWAALILEDRVGAASFAKRVVSHHAATCPDKALAGLALLKGPSPSHVDKGCETLRALLSSPEAASDEAAEDGAGAWIDWRQAAGIALAFQEGPSEGLAAWCASHEAAESLTAEAARPLRNALLLGAGWLFEALLDGSARIRSPRESAEDDEAPAPSGMVPLADAMRAARFASSSLELAVGEGGDAGWCELFAVSQLERVVKVTPALATQVQSAAAMSALRRVEMRVLSQREEYRRTCAHHDRKMEEYLETHPDAFRNEARMPRATNSKARSVAPSMYVSLFGSLEVRVGDEPVDSKHLKRQKTKALLAILVLAHGREVARDKLARMLWPESGIESARKNLYGAWAQLARALSVDGSCPYLVRDQQGCRINRRLVSSDVAEFESLCRTLLFGRSEELEWERVLARIGESYADDILPTETDVEAISAVRDKYRLQLTDALIAASSKLARTGETQGALWFAREAMHRDETREDVYAALMEAQIAAGQRAAAIDTFMACRRYLSEQLGIDPSPHIVSLYRSIIETEVALTR